MKYRACYISPAAPAGARSASPRSCSKASRPTAACTCPSAIRRSTPRRSRAGATLPYAELAFEMLSLYIDDIPAADLQRARAQDLHARDGVRHARRSCR